MTHRRQRAERVIGGRGARGLNILFLALDVDLAQNRGDAVHVCEAARFLGRRGNLVSLVTATQPDSVPSLGPSVHAYRRPDGTDIAVVRFCSRIARADRPDVIYERRLSPKVAFAVSRLTGSPFVVEVNGVEEEAAMQRRSPRSPATPLKRRARSVMFRRALLVVAVTEALAEVVRERHRLPSDRVVVIPNGVDSEAFRPMDPTKARLTLGWTEGNWIVFVGNLVPWQGLEFLLQAAPHVLRTHPTARIAIVGDGMSRPTLENLAKEIGLGGRLTFTGTVPHESVPLYIGASTVCVAPFTLARNQATGVSPLKLFEYLSCGRPVVASDVPGILAVLEESGGGVTVPAEDAGALAVALAHMLDDPARARAMGQRGREYAAAHCGWSENAERLEHALRAALARNTLADPSQR